MDKLDSGVPGARQRAWGWALAAWRWQQRDERAVKTEKECFATKRQKKQDVKKTKALCICFAERDFDTGISIPNVRAPFCRTDSELLVTIPHFSFFWSELLVETVVSFFCAKPVFTMETPASFTDAENIEHLRYQLRTVRKELRRIERERENALFTIKTLEDDINALLEKSRKAEPPAPKPQAPKEVQAPKPTKPAPAKRAPAKPAATQPASAPVEEVTVPDPRGPVVCGPPFPPSPFAAVFKINVFV